MNFHWYGMIFFIRESFSYVKVHMQINKLLPIGEHQVICLNTP